MANGKPEPYDHLSKADLWDQLQVARGIIDAARESLDMADDLMAPRVKLLPLRRKKPPPEAEFAKYLAERTGVGEAASLRMARLLGAQEGAPMARIHISWRHEKAGKGAKGTTFYPSRGGGPLGSGFTIYVDHDDVRVDADAVLGPLAALLAEGIEVDVQGYEE